MKKMTLFCFLLNFTFLYSQLKFDEKKVITDPFDPSYSGSRQYFYGQLKPEEHSILMGELEIELKTKLPRDKAIVINYNHAAYFCSFAKLNNSDKIRVIKNGIRISNRICKDNNAIDFFVYTKNSFFKKILEQNPLYILDSGYFSNKFFTKKESCKAYFVLKPNGHFITIYGTDQLSEVDNYLKKTHQ